MAMDAPNERLFDLLWHSIDFSCETTLSTIDEIVVRKSEKRLVGVNIFAQNDVDLMLSPNMSFSALVPRRTAMETLYVYRVGTDVVSALDMNNIKRQLPVDELVAFRQQHDPQMPSAEAWLVCDEFGVRKKYLLEQEVRSHVEAHFYVRQRGGDGTFALESAKFRRQCLCKLADVCAVGLAPRTDNDPSQSFAITSDGYFSLLQLLQARRDELRQRQQQQQLSIDVLTTALEFIESDDEEGNNHSTLYRKLRTLLFRNKRLDIEQFRTKSHNRMEMESTLKQLGVNDVNKRTAMVGIWTSVTTKVDEILTNTTAIASTDADASTGVVHSKVTLKLDATTIARNRKHARETYEALRRGELDVLDQELLLESSTSTSSSSFNLFACFMTPLVSGNTSWTMDAMNDKIFRKGNVEVHWFESLSAFRVTQRQSSSYFIVGGGSSDSYRWSCCEWTERYHLFEHRQEVPRN
jgi:hypothetical protein